MYPYAAISAKMAQWVKIHFADVYDFFSHMRPYAAMIVMMAAIIYIHMWPWTVGTCATRFDKICNHERSALLTSYAAMDATICSHDCNHDETYVDICIHERIRPTQIICAHSLPMSAKTGRTIITLFTFFAVMSAPICTHMHPYATMITPLSSSCNHMQKARDQH